MTDLTKGNWYTLYWKGEDLTHTVEFLYEERGFLIFQDEDGKKVVARLDSVRVVPNE